MSAYRRIHAAASTQPRPTAGHAPDSAPPDAPDQEAATRQPWWLAVAYRSQHAVPRATFLRSFVFAWNGLRHAILTQRNARVHALLAAVAIALGLWLRISPIEFAIVFVAISGVFISEMFNTVAEACVDLITDQYHPLAQVAKDVAAGAVLLNAVLSVVIGLFIYVPHLWPLVSHGLAR